MNSFRRNVNVRVGARVAAHPKVSVIMPAFNVSMYIEEAVKSVFAQSIQDFELIVINDGSPDSDEMERVLHPYFEQLVYVVQENSGCAAARNVGLELSRGTYSAFLDPDDSWLPKYLEVQLKILEEDPSIDVVYPDAVIFGDLPDSGRRVMELSPSVGEVTFESLILQKCTVLVSALSRRETLMRIGKFDPTLRSSEDFDLWLRLLKAGGRIDYHRQVLVRYRRRAGSLSADSVWMYRHMLQVLEKFESDDRLTEGERSSLTLAKKRFSAELSLCEAKRALCAGEHSLALEKLVDANAFLDRRKIALAIPILRVAPRFACRVYGGLHARLYPAG